MAGTAKVLIVDDDVNYADTTVDLLNEKGFDCVGVHSGREAMDKVKEVAFDVVLLDVRMPVMNGVETYREIKKIRPQAVIVFVTAYRMDELAKDALKEGACGLVYKPVDINRMVSVIERSRKGGLLVMVVDDDANTCETLKDNLEERGYVVTTALNGDEAIKIAQERPNDVVFIDAKLPPLNGLVVYLDMKRINPDVVAVMMTGYRDEMKDVVEKALEEGAFACLYKPFGVNEVMVILEGVISRMKGGK